MQLVGYDTAPPDGEAALLAATEGAVERLPLDAGTDLTYRLGERHCAGSLDEEGHTACTNPEAPYCPTHTNRWACARCTGDCDLPLETCREDHAVYLAAFAPATFKVGVTRDWRLETRLREQGADRGAHLRTVTDGRIARQVEADIATEVGDSVRVPRKIEGLAEPVDEAAWRALLAGFDSLETFAFDYGLSLPDRPVAETLLTGEVVGTKGRVLVLAHEGSNYAVDMRDLVGYDLAEGEPERRLQASLGAF